MSEPILYRIEPDAATTGQQIRAVDDAIQDGVLVPVEPDLRAMDKVHRGYHNYLDHPEPYEYLRELWLAGAGIGGDDSE